MDALHTKDSIKPTQHGQTIDDIVTEPAADDGDGSDDADRKDGSEQDEEEEHGMGARAVAESAAASDMGRPEPSGPSDMGHEMGLDTPAAATTTSEPSHEALKAPRSLFKSWWHLHTSLHLLGLLLFVVGIIVAASQWGKTGAAENQHSGVAAAAKAHQGLGFTILALLALQTTVVAYWRVKERAREYASPAAAVNLDVNGTGPGLRAKKVHYLLGYFTILLAWINVVVGISLVARGWGGHARSLAWELGIPALVGAIGVVGFEVWLSRRRPVALAAEYETQMRNFDNLVAAAAIAKARELVAKEEGLVGLVDVGVRSDSLTSSISSQRPGSRGSGAVLFGRDLPPTRSSARRAALSSFTSTSSVAERVAGRVAELVTDRQCSVEGAALGRERSSEAVAQHKRSFSLPSVDTPAPMESPRASPDLRSVIQDATDMAPERPSIAARLAPSIALVMASNRVTPVPSPFSTQHSCNFLDSRNTSSSLRATSSTSIPPLSPRREPMLSGSIGHPALLSPARGSGSLHSNPLLSPARGSGSQHSNPLPPLASKPPLPPSPGRAMGVPKDVLWWEHDSSNSHSGDPRSSHSSAPEAWGTKQEASDRNSAPAVPAPAPTPDQPPSPVRWMHRRPPTNSPRLPNQIPESGHSPPRADVGRRAVDDTPVAAAVHRVGLSPFMGDILVGGSAVARSPSRLSAGEGGGAGGGGGFFRSSSALSSPIKPQPSLSPGSKHRSPSMGRAESMGSKW